MSLNWSQPKIIEEAIKSKIILFGATRDYQCKRVFILAFPRKCVAMDYFCSFPFLLFFLKSKKASKSYESFGNNTKELIQNIKGKREAVKMGK